MSQPDPTIVWIRRDLRLKDHRALSQATSPGGPVIVLFIRDDLVDGLGAAPKLRLEKGLETFGQALRAVGSRLILRSGPALDVLQTVLAETGATSVYWQRAYDPVSVARDTKIKSCLQTEGIDAQSFAGHLLFEPWTVETKQGGAYRVFSPFWRAVRGLPVADLQPTPSRIPAPKTWPKSEDLAEWGLSRAMRRGAEIVSGHITAGSDAAEARLAAFCDQDLAKYAQCRDFPAQNATSELSDYLALGEISPARCWHAGFKAMEQGNPGAERFLFELVWREFAWHLLWHSPHMLTEAWREEWQVFPWDKNENRSDVRAWKQARTGVPLVDAGLRELYVTGRMHNRVRMVVASYLTKNLRAHWRIGQDWFADCLTDWDPASNAMGWQWVAGCGPDAAPYFRIFNPLTQAEKFDPDGAYRRRWLGGPDGSMGQDARSYFDAVPKSWNLQPGPLPPVPDLAKSRRSALDAYAHFKSDETA